MLTHTKAFSLQKLCKGSRSREYTLKRTASTLYTYIRNNEVWQRGDTSPLSEDTKSSRKSIFATTAHAPLWQAQCSNIYQRNWWSLEAWIHCGITPSSNLSQHLCHFSFDMPKYFPFKHFLNIVAALIAEVVLQVEKRIKIIELKDNKQSYS